MMKNNFLPTSLHSIDDSDRNAVLATLKAPGITRGERVEQFEAEIANYCHARYAVAFNSGSTALLNAFRAVKVDRFDRAITSVNTFIATISGAVQSGALPIFVDIDRKTGNLDVDHVDYALKRKYTRGKSVIIPVHFSGIAVDMAKLDRMIASPSTIVIEDGCHAFGSQYPSGERVGSCTYSQMTVFSFHPSKTITSGEGGVVTTNDESLYRRLRRLRNNDIERQKQHLPLELPFWKYEIEELSSSYNLTEMQAALGLSQMQRAALFIEKRRELVTAYNNHLNTIPQVTLFSTEQLLYTAYHLFVIQVDFEGCGITRQEVMDSLQEQGIATQLHYIPLYRHAFFYKRYSDLSPYFPEMELYYQQAISLPLYYDMTSDDVARVVKALCKTLRIENCSSPEQ